MMKNTTDHVPDGCRRRGRPPMARTLLACAGLIAVLLVSAAPSGADEPALVPASADVVISPSTLLLDGQSVTITGTGYPANTSVGMVECIHAVPGVGGCNMSTLVFTTTDASGNFTTTFTVRRVLHIGSTTTDCADVGACRIGAGVPPDGAVGAGSDIQFDPSVPLPPAPTLSASPSTGLLDGQSVTVTGSGFPSNVSVGMVECLNAVPGAGGCKMSTLVFATTDASGNLTTTFTVKRVLRIGSTTTDCADVGACRIGAGVPPDGSDGAASADIQFDPSVPLPPPPVLVASPSTDLLDRQSVTVTGTGFPSNAQVVLIECLAPSSTSGGCSYPTFTVVTTDGSGNLSTPFTVRRLLRSGSTTIDCAAPGTCEIGSGLMADGEFSAAAAIQFDPSAPLPPPPSLTVNQADDLADGQSVTVTGTNYPPGETVGVVQCRVGATISGGCSLFGIRYVTPNSAGGFTVTIQVSRMLVLGDVTTDCSVTGACFVGAGVLPVGNPSANAAIRFASDPVVPVFTG